VITPGQEERKSARRARSVRAETKATDSFPENFGEGPEGEDRLMNVLMKPHQFRSRDILAGWWVRESKKGSHHKVKEGGEERDYFQPDVHKWEGHGDGSAAK